MLERRRKPRPEPGKVEPDPDAEDKLRESSEAARRDASRRAAELLARLRKL